MTEKHIDENEPISVVINYVILDKDDEAFKTLMREAISAARHFKGFRGKHFFFTKEHGKTNYYILMQFDTLADLKSWEESSIRQEYITKLNQFTETTSTERHYLTGLESWFALGVNKPIIPPPRYKIAILTWASAYCLLLIIFTLAGSYLSELTLPLRIFVVSITLVILITYVVMPFLTRRLKRWLYPTLQ